MKTKSLIIEDEKHCYDRLETFLKKNHNGQIDLLGWADTIESGITAINKYSPDLIFLDVELGNENAFDLLRNINESNFDIIFTTAYQEYALKAIKLSALDYLLKPIDEEELGFAIQKLFNKSYGKEISEKLDVLFEHIASQPSQEKRISIPTLNGFEYVPIKHIIRCQADVNYTHVFLEKNQKLTVAKTLKEFEAMLTPYGFFRVHNSHLVNMQKVARYIKGKGGFLILDNETEIEVSSRRKEELIHILKGI